MQLAVFVFAVLFCLAMPMELGTSVEGLWFIAITKGVAGLVAVGTAVEIERSLMRCLKALTTARPPLPPPPAQPSSARSLGTVAQQRP